MPNILLTTGLPLLLASGAFLTTVPTVPSPESYGSAVNANASTFSFQSTSESRDQQVSFTRNYVGTIYLRLTSDGQAIMFDFHGSYFNIYVASGVTEASASPTVTKQLHSQGGGISGTVVVKVIGFEIIVTDDGVEIVRFKSLHHVKSGKIACKEALGQTRSAGTITFYEPCYLWSDIVGGDYDPRDFGLRSIATTGSISGSSTSLTVASAAGFVVGDRVLVETGTESGVGARGTKGVGGTWPALSYANAAARTADSSQANNTFAWQEDTGEVWRWVSGAWTQPYDATYYYLNKAHARALQATITGISGNVLTLSAAAAVTATNANVYLDCTPFVNLMTYNIWYKFGGTNGDLRDFQPTNARIMFPAGTYYFGGKIYLGAHAAEMRFEGQGDTTILKSPKGCPSISILVTAHSGQNASNLKTVVRRLKMIGNVQDEGFGMDYENTSALPYGSGASGFEWSYDSGSLTQTSISTGPGASPGCLMSNCTNCVVEYITSVDVWQKAIGADFSTNCYGRHGVTTMTQGLRSYVQWHYQWSDSAGGAIEDCSITSPRLIAGCEIFRSDGTNITRFVGTNASMSSNSSGRFVWTDCEVHVTVTDNVQATTGFSKNNPMMNINSNIVPPSGAMLDGGSIIRPIMTQAAYIDADNNSLVGISVNANNPNVTISGGSYTAPDYQAGSSMFGALGIGSGGSNTDVTGFTCVGKAQHEVTGSSGDYRNIDLRGGGGSSAIGCTANEIYVNP